MTSHCGNSRLRRGARCQFTTRNYDQLELSIEELRGSRDIPPVQTSGLSTAFTTSTWELPVKRKERQGLRCLQDVRWDGILSPVLSIGAAPVSVPGQKDIPCTSYDQIPSDVDAQRRETFTRLWRPRVMQRVTFLRGLWYRLC